MAKCTACGTENQAGEKFCVECGMEPHDAPTEQAQSQPAVNGQTDVANPSEQFETYRVEFEKVAKNGSLNLLARRKMRTVKKTLNLSDDQAKAFEERVLTEWKQQQTEIAARKAEEQRVLKEELDRKRCEEEARRAEEERIHQEELEKKRREEEARKAEEDRIHQEERERKRRKRAVAKKAREAEKDCKSESSDNKSSDSLSTVFIAILTIVFVGLLIWGGWWLICLLFRHWIITGLIVIGLIFVGAAASK